jgi:site-specific DNA recombinase
MVSRPPRPRQPVDDVLGAADPFVGGTEEVLSYLHDVAIKSQPGDIETGPVMVPVAFVGRVSHKDNQDPTLSIPRQLARCRAALPPYCVIVAFFWDVESGRTDLDLRGHSDAYQLFNVPVPRDGGVDDLLEEARHPTRRFVAVVCESVDRISRITYIGTKIEYELEKSGVALLAADEGITDDSLPGATGRPVRKRATPILTRRVKQAIAEFYVLDMLEKSWGGLMEHTEQGFNIGKPPYGYQVVVEKHPVPAKAALAMVKRRLVRDPIRGPVVTQIYTWRVTEHLSYDQIADRLNLDPERYPPPQPILGAGRRAIGAWTKGSVRDVLCNPKYTGYMVYNRRRNPRRDRGVPGRSNPRSEWIWSSKPTHEPLTTRAQFDVGTPIGKNNRGSRTSNRPNSHPATTRTYRLRSYVICELCGLRLSGKTRRVGDVYSYYACEPVPARHSGKDWFATHPKSLWVREDKLLKLVRSFFSRRIFGPDREVLLVAGQAEESTLEDPTAARMRALRGKIRELERQQANVVRELREYQPIGDEEIDRQWRGQLRESFTDIAAQRKDLDAQLVELATQAQTPTKGDPRLLDRLPIIESDLGRLSEDVERELFDGFHLQVRYHHLTRRVTLRVTIDGESVQRLARTSQANTRGGRVGSKNKEGSPAARAAGDPRSFSLAVCAPGGSRTHTVGGLSSVPLPVGLRGPRRIQGTHYADDCGNGWRGVEYQDVRGRGSWPRLRRADSAGGCSSRRMRRSSASTWPRCSSRRGMTSSARRATARPPCAWPRS